MGLRHWWETRHLPRLMDRALNDPRTHAWREQTCGTAHGDVVELGFGSGLNLRWYGPNVRRVLAIEPSDLAWSLAQRRIARVDFEVERIGLDGARVDLPDQSADTIVSSWTMCTIPAIDAALSEVHRLLKPGSELRFTEHGIADDTKVARRQRRIQHVWGPVAGGCHVDRDIPALLKGAGFDVRIDQQEYMIPGFSEIFTWQTRGVATPTPPG